MSVGRGPGARSVRGEGEVAPALRTMMRCSRHAETWARWRSCLVCASPVLGTQDSPPRHPQGRDLRHRWVVGILSGIFRNLCASGVLTKAAKGSPPPNPRHPGLPCSCPLGASRCWRQTGRALRTQGRGTSPLTASPDGRTLRPLLSPAHPPPPPSISRKITTRQDEKI